MRVHKQCNEFYKLAKPSGIEFLIKIVNEANARCKGQIFPKREQMWDGSTRDGLLVNITNQLNLMELTVPDNLYEIILKAKKNTRNYIVIKPEFAEYSFGRAESLSLKQLLLKISWIEAQEGYQIEFELITGGPAGHIRKNLFYGKGGSPGKGIVYQGPGLEDEDSE